MILKSNLDVLRCDDCLGSLLNLQTLEMNKIAWKNLFQNFAHNYKILKSRTVPEPETERGWLMLASRGVALVIRRPLWHWPKCTCIVLCEDDNLWWWWWLGGKYGTGLSALALCQDDGDGDDGDDDGGDCDDDDMVMVTRRPLWTHGQYVLELCEHKLWDVALIAKTGKDNMWTHYASGTKIGSWSRIIMVITGSERAALLHWRRREKVKKQAIFPPRFCTRKTCWGLFTLTRLEGKLSWIWFYVEHSGLKSRKRGVPKMA